MIPFQKHTLPNGLRVIIHQDKNTPLAAVNLLYDVGARDEDPEKTGFAHLFEHLMFGGSVNIPAYDQPLQEVGGENNAFTNNDITNYYITLPEQNLETAFWLESDRMLSLAFSEKSLEVQRNVVIEEFKQRYLNQPYGDVWLLLRPLVYKTHPYRWATIGKEISHIENATMQDVKDFFFRHYAPNNCVMTVAGNIDPDEVFRLCETYFAEIPRREVPERKLPVELPQTEARFLEVERPVPVDAIYKAWHIGDRLSTDHYITDLISDIFSNGKSARLHQKLVKEKQLFSEINAYISGEKDPGMIIITGNPSPGVSLEQANEAINKEVERLVSRGVAEEELQKVKNKVESSLQFSEVNILNKAMNLSYFESLGDAGMINQETEKYQAVTIDQVHQVAGEIFQDANCSTLFYRAINGI
ncbi:MAG: insulinase family protein [Bacteroidales bacterium]|nr:insulinase family protein [Bacteroidales bacterium]MCF8457908.1 insulinase family protein [Bacteroidales bacterium]